MLNFISPKLVFKYLISDGTHIYIFFNIFGWWMEDLSTEYSNLSVYQMLHTHYCLEVLSFTVFFQRFFFLPERGYVVFGVLRPVYCSVIRSRWSMKLSYCAWPNTNLSCAQLHSLLNVICYIKYKQLICVICHMIEEHWIWTLEQRMWPVFV